MKKLSIILTAFIIILLIVLTLSAGGSSSFTAVITAGVFASLLFSYFYFEKSSMGVKEIALIATLSAFSAAARVIFAPLPNIKPITFLVALSGFVFGPYEGFLVGGTSAFLSNIFLGQGLWTPWQMFAWGIVGALSGFLGKSNKKITALMFSIICFLYGFLFDWIMNLWHVLGFIRPITIKTIALTYASGFTFDITHACGNFVFSMIFYNNFLKVLTRFKKRMEITYIN